MRYVFDSRWTKKPELEKSSSGFVSVRVCKMYMVVDMLLTEAAIALTAGAVAEFKLRMVPVGFAADTALVVI